MLVSACALPALFFTRRSQLGLEFVNNSEISRQFYIARGWKAAVYRLPEQRASAVMRSVINIDMLPLEQKNKKASWSLLLK